MKNLQVKFELHEEEQESWYKIKNFIHDKYGKLHGVLGKEAINLMLLGLEKTPVAHTQKHLTRTINNRLCSLLSFLSQHHTIDEPTLKEATGDLVGYDKRTYEKYLFILKSKKIIKYSRTINKRKGNKLIRIYSVDLTIVRRELKRLKGDD